MAKTCHRRQRYTLFFELPNYNIMKRSVLKFFVILPLLCSCGSRTSTVEEFNDTIPEPEALAATPLASAAQINYEITLHDSTVDGKLTTLRDLHREAPGHMTFRGSTMRDADFGGTVKGRPSKIVQRWMFKTGLDTKPTNLGGAWGGGTGWTSQPLYVEWPDSVRHRFTREKSALTGDSVPRQEVMVASLASEVYFLDFQTGQPSREPLDTHNPVKGTMCLDPQLNGNLYVGQAVAHGAQFGRLAFNLFSHKETYFHDVDRTGWVSWQGNDSSPVVVGGYLFFPCENGCIYKYYIDGDSIRLHTTFRWKTNKPAAGMENSLCVYRNYGFIGNNRGDVMCLELNTMTPIWYYDNHDDIDASIVCEVENDVPYLYCGSEVDQQGTNGNGYLVKLNGLTGELVWENTIPCTKIGNAGKHFDGGFYSTPLLGHGNCEELFFTNVCQREGSKNAEFTAFKKKTGEVVYRVQLDTWAWSSPVGFYNEQNELFIFAGDTAGNAYLIEGKTGNVLYKERLANNFESSPVVVGNELVVGSRGQEVHKFAIE